MKLVDIRLNTTKIGCDIMIKIVGWNIFVEEQDENGKLELVAWNISDGLARAIEQEYAELLEYIEGDEEE